ncbi:hypothetical protein [Neorhizobium sp. JUb45]|uniref:hypothetical protein n=1 Tax=Neorhizobium sp. JUb45 TaxID=2485113 RepID=UPI001046A22A|nr:hypothetical protein [Neorhizobium sp. JUb45]TCR01095.1 hypothetical protein EDF70_105100 [Neorhizobium sp. JUb45]
MSHPTKFDGSNLIMRAPAGAENVQDMHVFQTRHSCVSCWTVSGDELAEISATGKIFLSVLMGGQQPPVYVGSESTCRAVMVDFGPVWPMAPRPAEYPTPDHPITSEKVEKLFEVARRVFITKAEESGEPRLAEACKLADLAIGDLRDAVLKAIAGSPSPSTHVQPIVTSIDTMREAAKDVLVKRGWKPGHMMGFQNITGLMAEFGMQVYRGEIGCDYPNCGCCADAACEDAIKQHPDLGGTPPQTNVAGDSPMRFFSENVDKWGAAEWFDRLANAIREQDKAVVAKDQISVETFRMIAASSAMTLVRDHEEAVRSALSPYPQTNMRAYPQELTDDLRDILSLMMWNTGPMAHALRAGGQDIKRKAEEEQAEVMHWLIGLALEHGSEWRAKASDRIREIKAALATTEGQPDAE